MSLASHVIHPVLQQANLTPRSFFGDFPTDLADPPQINRPDSLGVGTGAAFSGSNKRYHFDILGSKLAGSTRPSPMLWLLRRG